MADAFADPQSRRAVDEHHVEGYNVMRIGGSVGFVEDPDQEVKFKNAGQRYQAGEAGYTLQKEVWENFFARR